MAFKQIEMPPLGRSLSNIMAHPSSAECDEPYTALDEYFRSGGNCVHLHDEGGAGHSRRATGRWLQRRGSRAEIFVCTQICHAGWDPIRACAIDRFNAKAVCEDIDTDLELLATEYLDLVYLDDNPQKSLEPVIESLGREIAHGRIRAFGVRNWTAERIEAAHAYAFRKALAGPAVIVTTELALAAATAPLWPEYIPFDEQLRSTIRAFRLAVFAHAADINLGQCLYGDGDATTRFRQHWVERWDSPANRALVLRVRQFAAERGLTPREVNVAWILNQPFPSVAIVSLSSLQARRPTPYERASHVALEQADRDFLDGFAKMT